MLGCSLAHALCYPPRLGLQCARQALHGVAGTASNTAPAVTQVIMRYPGFGEDAANLESGFLHGKQVGRRACLPCRKPDSEFSYFGCSVRACAILPDLT